MSFEITKKTDDHGVEYHLISIETKTYGALIDKDPDTGLAMTAKRATEIAEKIVEIVIENERQADVAEAEKLKAETDQLAADESLVSEPEIMDDFWATPGV